MTEERKQESEEMKNYRRFAKEIRKQNNGDSLMQIQHKIAKELGFKSWAELKKERG